MNLNNLQRGLKKMEEDCNSLQFSTHEQICEYFEINFGDQALHVLSTIETMGEMETEDETQESGSFLGGLLAFIMFVFTIHSPLLIFTLFKTYMPITNDTTIFTIAGIWLLSISFGFINYIILELIFGHESKSSPLRSNAFILAFTRSKVKERYKWVLAITLFLTILSWMGR